MTKHNLPRPDIITSWPERKDISGESRAMVDRELERITTVTPHRLLGAGVTNGPDGERYDFACQCGMKEQGPGGWAALFEAFLVDHIGGGKS